MGKAFLYIIIFFGFSTSIQAQNAKPIFDWEELIFSENHFSLQFIYGRSQKAVIDPDPHMYNISTTSYECLEGGIGYHYSINKKYSIQMGIRGGGIMRDIRYDIPGAAFSPPLSYDVSSYKNGDKSGVPYFRAPFFIERRFFKKPGVFWNAQIGVSILYSFFNEEGFISTIVEPNNRQIDYLYGEFTPNNNQKPWLNYHIGGGLNLILRNKDILRISLVSEISFTQFYRGYYSFTIPGQPLITFDYGVTGTYVALEASYIRTKAKRKFKQLKLQ